MNNKTSIIIAGSVAGVIVIFMVLISLFKFGVIGDYNTPSNSTNKEPETPSQPTITTRTLSCNRSGEDTETGSILTETLAINFENDILTTYSSTKTYQFSNLEDYTTKGAILQNRVGTNIVDGLNVTVMSDEAQTLYTESLSATMLELQNANWLTSRGLMDFTYNSINTYAISQGFSC